MAPPVLSTLGQVTRPLCLDGNLQCVSNMPITFEMSFLFSLGSVGLTSPQKPLVAQGWPLVRRESWKRRLTVCVCVCVCVCVSEDTQNEVRLTWLEIRCIRLFRSNNSVTITADASLVPAGLDSNSPLEPPPNTELNSETAMDDETKHGKEKEQVESSLRGRPLEPRGC